MLIITHYIIYTIVMVLFTSNLKDLNATEGEPLCITDTYIHWHKLCGHRVNGSRVTVLCLRSCIINDVLQWITAYLASVIQTLHLIIWMPK